MIDPSQARRALVEKYLQGKLPQMKTEIASIPRRDHGEYAPLSWGQQQLWLLARLLPDTPVYTECVTIHLPGPLDTHALTQSYNEILRRHEAWRTSFPVIDGEPVQWIHPHTPLALPIVDVSHLPHADREKEALRLAAEDAQKPFDLPNGPLQRASLIRLSEFDHHLFLTLHHIIFDGYSLYQVFLSELRALYEAFSQDKPSALPDLPIQYADFAAWQRQQMAGEEFTRQLAYWKTQLAGAPASLALPTDHPRPMSATYRGSAHPFALSQRLTRELKALGRREGVTLYMMLVAAFQALLYRHTGQEDMVIGTAMADRKHTDVQGLLGFFLNTLVLRTNMSGNPSFRELLARVREVVLEAQAHPDVPFEVLVKELAPERTAGQNPLFQALLTLVPSLASHPSGWTLTQMDVPTNTAKFDLSIELEDPPEGLRGRFEYNTDLFDASTIARMAEHWLHLLASIVSDPGKRLSELDMLGEAERRQILVEWNDTQVAYPKDQTVHQVFEAQVGRTPNATALVFAGQTMTYGELNARANQLARHLQELGAGPGTLIGLCMDRSLEMIVSLLGILKVGGAYVPLDPAYPRERLAFMLSDTCISVLLTQKHLVHLLSDHKDFVGTRLIASDMANTHSTADAIKRISTKPWGIEGVQVVCLDTRWETIAHEQSGNLDCEVPPESLAYVMYTSGSTGRPKGVEIRHRSILRLVCGANYVRLDETRTILHMAPISFDAATFEVWGALLHGARCILFPERIPTPKSIGRIMHTHHVTTAWLTASLFNAVIDEAPEALSEAEEVLTGGEALSVTHIRRALSKLPTTRLINGYGPTESTTFACCYPIPRQIPDTWRSIPIGRPISNTRVYILDRHRQLVPVGVPGELYIGGDGVARGYFQRHELSAERFIIDPFSEDADARLYKTGDLARYLPDGALEFLGRLDSQVKIRGFRIEPGEIEAVLQTHPAVREALVIVHEDERREKRLIAYVVLQPGQQRTSEELSNFLKQHLPEYMIPSALLSLDALPITPNGKIDRRALPMPARVVSNGELEAESEPLLAIHYQLIQIWEELLAVRPIGIQDNFFELGGHSLTAARLFDRIEQVFGKKLPLNTLYGAATIERLAAAILGEEGAQSPTPVIAVQASGTRRPFFFLHGEWAGGGFYSLNLARYLDADQPFYVLEPYRFEGLVDLPAFEEMAAAHLAALRSVQPEGPYLLGGFCNGGLIAYEMARQLVEQGETVDLLVLIDPAVPGSHKYVRRVIHLLGKLTGQSEWQQLGWFLFYIYLRISEYRKKVQDIIQQQTNALRQERGIALRLPTAEALYHRWGGIYIYRWLVAKYDTLKSYTGKIAFFWSTEAFEKNVVWRESAEVAGVDNHIFPGTHLGCKTDNLHLIARRLNLYLQDFDPRQE